MEHTLLQQYVQKLLEDIMGELSDEHRKQFVPEVASQLEERVGLMLLPMLSKEQLKDFATLLDGEPTDEKIVTFWKESIPKFEEELERIVNSFAEDVKQAISA